MGHRKVLFHSPLPRRVKIFKETSKNKQTKNKNKTVTWILCPELHLCPYLTPLDVWPPSRQFLRSLPKAGTESDDCRAVSTCYIFKNILCVCVHVPVWRPEGDLWELVLSKMALSCQSLLQVRSMAEPPPRPLLDFRVIHIFLCHQEE